MLDLKLIRENPELIRKGITSKNEKDRIDEVLQLDQQRRDLIANTEELKAKRNQGSAEVAKIKRAGGDASELMNQMKEISEKATENDAKLKEIEEALNNIMMYLPNTPHSSVPIGKSSEDNIEARVWLPDGFTFEKEFAMHDHIELGKRLKILDFERGAKISGSGFPLYLGKGATLERALINFMLDMHIHNHGFSEVFPPFLVNRDSMKGTGQLPKMEDDMYHAAKDDLFLIPTAEVPITNIYRNDILNESDLPIKYVGYSACFRREAGSYGKDSKGFLRVHQFNKVEMVEFVKPETSYEQLELLVNNAENILKALFIPYRILSLCTGDLSFSAAKCYDIETWSPAENKWLESSSCSNFENFQARRANIRFRNEKTKKLEFVHTLNGSGLATSRLMVSILENYQTPEGKIIVPKALQKYTGFDIID